VAGTCAATERTTRMTVAVLAAPSVSQMALDEALWTASGLLEAAGTLDTSS
jgi:hypothetical protein